MRPYTYGARPTGSGHGGGLPRGDARRADAGTDMKPCRCGAKPIAGPRREQA